MSVSQGERERVDLASRGPDIDTFEGLWCFPWEERSMRSRMEAEEKTNENHNCLRCMDHPIRVQMRLVVQGGATGACGPLLSVWAAPWPDGPEWRPLGPTDGRAASEAQQYVLHRGNWEENYLSYRYSSFVAKASGLMWVKGGPTGMVRRTRIIISSQQQSNS